MSVYLLHSSVRIGGEGKKGAQHYVGYCRRGDFARRIERHIRGIGGARIIDAFLQRGARLYVGNYWDEGTREMEVQLKRNGHLDQKCRICRGEVVGEMVYQPPLQLPLLGEGE